MIANKQKFTILIALLLFSLQNTFSSQKNPIGHSIDQKISQIKAELGVSPSAGKAKTTQPKWLERLEQKAKKNTTPQTQIKMASQSNKTSNETGKLVPVVQKKRFLTSALHSVRTNNKWNSKGYSTDIIYKRRGEAEKKHTEKEIKRTT
jgi:hypothetical protein